MGGDSNSSGVGGGHLSDPERNENKSTSAMSSGMSVADVTAMSESMSSKVRSEFESGQGMLGGATQSGGMMDSRSEGQRAATQLSVNDEMEQLGVRPRVEMTNIPLSDIMKSGLTPKEAVSFGPEVVSQTAKAREVGLFEGKGIISGNAVSQARAVAALGKGTFGMTKEGMGTFTPDRGVIGKAIDSVLGIDRTLTEEDIAQAGNWGKVESISEAARRGTISRSKTEGLVEDKAASVLSFGKIVASLAMSAIAPPKTLLSAATSVAGLATDVSSFATDRSLVGSLRESGIIGTSSSTQGVPAGASTDRGQRAAGGLDGGNGGPGMSFPLTETQHTASYIGSPAYIQSTSTEDEEATKKRGFSSTVRTSYTGYRTPSIRKAR